MKPCPNWVFASLLKDAQGRIHYPVAWNGNDRISFFINGRPPRYHHMVIPSEEEFNRIFTRFEPPEDKTVLCVPTAGFTYRLRSNNLSVSFRARDWNGWHAVEIGDYPKTRWYLLSARTIQKYVVGEPYSNSYFKQIRANASEVISDYESSV